MTRRTDAKTPFVYRLRARACVCVVNSVTSILRRCVCRKMATRVHIRKDTSQKPKAANQPPRKAITSTDKHNHTSSLTPVLVTPMDVVRIVSSGQRAHYRQLRLMRLAMKMPTRNNPRWIVEDANDIIAKNLPRGADEDASQQIRDDLSDLRGALAEATKQQKDAAAGPPTRQSVVDCLCKRTSLGILSALADKLSRSHTFGCSVQPHNVKKPVTNASKLLLKSSGGPEDQKLPDGSMYHALSLCGVTSELHVGECVGSGVQAHVYELFKPVFHEIGSGDIIPVVVKQVHLTHFIVPDTSVDAAAAAEEDKKKVLGHVNLDAPPSATPMKGRVGGGAKNSDGIRAWSMHDIHKAYGPDLEFLLALNHPTLKYGHRDARVALPPRTCIALPCGGNTLLARMRDPRPMIKDTFADPKVVAGQSPVLECSHSFLSEIITMSMACSLLASQVTPHIACPLGFLLCEEAGYIIMRKNAGSLRSLMSKKSESIRKKVGFTWTCDSVVTMLVQTLHTLQALQFKFFIMHNDYNVNNLLVHWIKQESGDEIPQYHIYGIDYKQWHVRNCGFFIEVADYGFATKCDQPRIHRRDIVRGQFEKGYNITTKFQCGYDALFFLGGLFGLCDELCDQTTHAKEATQVREFLEALARCILRLLNHPAHKDVPRPMEEFKKMVLDPDTMRPTPRYASAITPEDILGESCFEKYRKDDYDSRSASASAYSAHLISQL